MADSNIVSRSRGIGIETIAAIGAVMIILLAFAYFSNRTQQELRKSPSGFNGLVHWLNSQSTPSRAFAGGWSIDPETIGISIVPIFDTNPLVKRQSPKTKNELLLQSDEYDLGLPTILSKREAVKTMLILPKWRSGLRLARVAHPILLNDTASAKQTLTMVSSGAGINLTTIPTPFSDFEYIATDGTVLTARTYVSRVFKGPDCDPVIGTKHAMILGKCAFKDQMPFFILSDPDLFNNHGLRLADNAKIALDFLSREAGDNLVLVDTSTDFWFYSPKEFQRPERTWADLAQFFNFPFSFLWIGLGGLLLLAVWRAGLRFGPIQGVTSQPGAAKHLAISARARLLRLTGKNRAMLSDYCDARLAVVLTSLFGPAFANNKSAGLDRLAKRAPERFARLSNLLARLDTMAPHTTPHDAIQFVDEFETLVNEIENDT